MCGICGIISWSGQDLSSIVRRMTEKLRHRGPDAEGYLEDPTIGLYLGHRRLSIIDLSERGNQPLYNEDRTMALICNGELYGFENTRKELEELGHRFYSNSDNEILLHSYEEWGVKAWDCCNGIFAAAIYDIPEKRICLVRDHLGVKPLFWLLSSQGVAFSSEAKAFFELPAEWWQPSLDMSAVSRLIDMPYLLDREQTLFEGVRMLPPASWLEIDLKKARVRGPSQYWKLQADAAIEELTESDAVSEVETALLRSVRKQMVADVPVGILLSGGIDSSLITALAQAERNGPVHTFTATFDHQLDERRYASIVAEHVGTNHTEISVDPSEINRRIEEIVYYYDDLRSVEGGIFTLYLLSEKIRELGIKVLLFGEGSDEIFGGYSWYGLSRPPLCWLPPFFRSAIHHYAVSRTFSRSSNWEDTRRFHRVVRSYAEQDILRQVSHIEIEHQLPNHFLMKVDRATMAHSLEGRVPFLDRDLVELAFSLPPRYKYAGGWFNFKRADEKHILRRVAEKYLPPAIVGRKKQGFMIPMSRVLKSNPDKVRDYVMAGDSVSRRLLPTKALERLFDYRPKMYSPIHKEKEFLLWRCFLLEVWASKYHLK